MARLATAIPLAKALRLTKVKSKMWRDLVEARLIDPARRPTEGKSYEITHDQFEQLKHIRVARKRIHGRFTLGKLAFELAEEGDRSIPVALLRKEVLKRVDGFFGFTTRQLQRHFGLSSKISSVTESDVYAAAKKFSNRLTNKLPMVKRIAASTAINLVTSMLLRMMYLKRSNPFTHVGGIKELVLRHLAVDSPAKGHVGISFVKARELGTQIVTMLSGLSEVITLHESSNILYKAVRNVNDVDFWEAFEAEKLASCALFDFHDELSRDIKLPKLDQKERSTGRALVLASIIAYQAAPRAKRTDELQELLAGSDRKARELLNQLLQAIRNLIKLQPLLDSVRGEKHAP